MKLLVSLWGGSGIAADSQTDGDRSSHASLMPEGTSVPSSSTVRVCSVLGRLSLHGACAAGHPSSAPVPCRSAHCVSAAFSSRASRTGKGHETPCSGALTCQVAHLRQ